MSESGPIGNGLNLRNSVHRGETALEILALRQHTLRWQFSALSSKSTWVREGPACTRLKRCLRDGRQQERNQDCNDRAPITRPIRQLILIMILTATA